MKAIITGSFDPITLGHEDLIRRACALFDSVTVAICINSSKTGRFTPDQRMTIARAALADQEKVNLVFSSGLLATYCAEHDIGVIVRGIRSGADADYEIALSRINGDVAPGLETILLPTNPAYSHISSNVVREMLRYDHSPAAFVSPAALNAIGTIIDEK